MSYKSDKNKMNKQLSDKKNRLAFIIKITFIALFVSLIALVITLFVVMFVDNEAPVIKPAGAEEVIGYVGEIPTYKKYVVVTDNLDGNIEPEVNSTGVNINKEGRYIVRYRAIDSAGNETRYELIYVVKKDSKYKQQKLNEWVEYYAGTLGITKNMGKQEQVERIYSFVNNIIAWSGGIGTSNIPDIDRNNWKIDWIEEAIRTFELYEAGDCEGDCYSYYSVSKAFFEYFGIKNIGLRRNLSLDEDHGTHFWNIVDIGNGKWYYYDATKLKGTFADGTRNACLINQTKLDSYQVTGKDKYNFYMISQTPDCLDFSGAGVNSYPTIAK